MQTLQSRKIPNWKNVEIVLLNKREERQEPWLHNENIYFKRIKTNFLTGTKQAITIVQNTCI